MADQQPVNYSLKFQSRALAAVPSEKFTSTWVVGTNALREENEIRFMQYDADQERLVCSKALVHGPEIWDIAACPTPQDLLMTIWSQGGNYGASLWSTSGPNMVQKICDLQGHSGIIRRALWHSSESELAVTIEEGALHKWQMSSTTASCTGSGNAGELLQLWSGCLSPHNTNDCITAGGNGIQCWDLRTMQVTSEVSAAHRMPVRDVCCSWINPHRLVTAGDDCKVRIWDNRALGRSEPLLELGGHSHWVWKAQFCPFHDQLLASGSSDSTVLLYHTPQVAASASSTSQASQDMSDVKVPSSDSGTGLTAAKPSGAVQRAGDLDGKVRTYEDHEDSVYGLSWSCVDPWLLASLSYDGRLVVNKVPKNIKYKIIV